MKRWLTVFVALVALLALAACGGDDDDATPTPTDTIADTSPTPTRTPVDVPIQYEVNVFAASSLTGPLTQMADDFEHLVPGVGINLTFGGSQDLRAQIEQGAQPDTFISADREQMDQLAAKGLIAGQRFIPARNKLAIIVPKANEANITTPEDLARPGLKIILGGESVPVGRYARLFLDAANGATDYGADYKKNVLGNVVSEASNVKEVVAAVQLDEVDAGIVYVTDVSGDVADDVTMIEIPDDFNQLAVYYLSSTVTGIPTPYAQDFTDFIISIDYGQITLAEYGFQPGN